MLNVRYPFGVLTALLLTFSLPLVLAAGTPAGTVITNQAAATYTLGGETKTEPSDPVETVISSVCSLSILPNGTLNAPAHDVTLETTGTIYLPYVLTNTGNDTLSFDLATRLEPDSTVTPDNAAIFLDQNANESFDSGEPEVTEVTLSADASAALLVAITVEAVTRAGDIYINLTGACASDPSINDTDNISHIIVPLLGFSAPVKTAEPEPGSVLYPGAALSYSISFTANSRLSNVVVTDTLSEYLTDPSSFTDGLVEDAETGLSAEVSAIYNAASRTLTWRFDSVPSGMNVSLHFDTAVRDDLDDLPPETLIENTASVTSEGVPATPTNTVTHDLRPIVIDLNKTASPNQVTVGDTLTYTLNVTNPPASVMLETLELIDTLPDEVRYQAGSSAVTYPDDTTDAVEPSVDGQTLSWSFEDLAPGETLTVTFDVTVLPAALYAEGIINEARALAQDAAGQAVADAAAAVSTVVELGVFEQRSVLLGVAFVDTDEDGLFDRDSDPTVKGLRLYLSDGSSTVTDEFGRYTFQNLEPSLTALRVDLTTAPNRYFVETPSEDREGLWRVRLEPGVITRQDIPFAPPQVRLEVKQHLNVFMGPLELEKRVFVLEDGLEVQLTITSSEALKNLVLDDALPENASLLSEPEFADGRAVDGEGLELSLGNIESGYKRTIRYTVAFDGSPETLLTMPEIRWDVR